MNQTKMALYLFFGVLAFGVAYGIFFGLSDSPVGLMIVLAVAVPLGISQVIITYREGRLRRICQSRSPVSTEEWIDRHYPIWKDKSEVICAVLDACGEVFGISPATQLRPTDCLTVDYGWLAQLNADDLPGAIAEELHRTLEREFPREWQPALDITTLDALITSVVVPAGVCKSCGYNLRRLTEHRCPECGMPFDEP